MTDPLAVAQASLDESGAFNIFFFDLRGKTALADYMLVASGTSARHVASVASKVAEKLKKQFKINSNIEGLPDANWVLVDTGDIIIHIFREEARAYYQIEELWQELLRPQKPSTDDEKAGIKQAP